MDIRCIDLIWHRDFDRIFKADARVVPGSRRHGSDLCLHVCCRSKPNGEQRQATRRAERLLGRWQALLPRRRPAIPAHAVACKDAGCATWPIPGQEGANVLATDCLHTQTRGNVSPSCGRLPGMTLASALKSRSSPGVRLDLHLSRYR